MNHNSVPPDPDRSQLTIVVLSVFALAAVVLFCMALNGCASVTTEVIHPNGTAMRQEASGTKTQVKELMQDFHGTAEMYESGAIKKLEIRSGHIVVDASVGSPIADVTELIKTIKE